MSQVTPLQRRPQLSRSDSRQLDRALSRLQAESRMGGAEIVQAAELQAVRVDAVTWVGKRALHNVALLSQLETQLVGLVPTATGRLQAIGDMTSLAVAEVVSDTLRQVR